MEKPVKPKYIPAKTCFSHIGGKLGNLLLDLFLEKNWISPAPGNSKHFFVTEKGKKELKKLGLDLSRIKEEEL